MEDISFFVWLGIAVIWFLGKLIRRGARKAARSQRQSAQPTVSQPAGPTSTAVKTRPPSQPEFLGRDGSGPPPIVPR